MRLSDGQLFLLMCADRRGKRGAGVHGSGQAASARALVRRKLVTFQSGFATVGHVFVTPLGSRVLHHVATPNEPERIMRLTPRWWADDEDDNTNAQHEVSQ